MPKKLLLFFIICALLVLGVYTYGNQVSRIGQSKIETVMVTRTTITDAITVSGKTSATEVVQLKFQTGGKLAWINVKEGDVVNAYTAVASLDTVDLQKNLTKTLRDYAKERSDFEEDRLVTYKDKVMTDTVKRILEKNQWDLDKAVIDVELKNVSITLATLISPIAGIVTRVDTPVANVNVTTNDIIEIINPASIVFRANVDETEIGSIHPEQEVEIELDAFPDTPFTGIVTQIAFASETTPAGATVFPVDSVFKDTHNLRVGLNGDMKVLLKKSPDSLSVPSEAVRSEANVNYVIIKEGASFSKRPVTLGLQTETETEIVSGVKEGELIVSKGFEYLPVNLR